MLKYSGLIVLTIALSISVSQKLSGQSKASAKLAVPGLGKIIGPKKAVADVIRFGPEEGLALSSFYGAMKDKDGNLWFGTAGGGASKYDGRAFENFTTAHGLAHNVVSSILQDQNGFIWFTTLGGGVSRYDGVQFKSFTVDDGLAENLVRCMLEDRKGNIWFGTLNNGISIFDGQSFKNVTTKDGLAGNTVWSFAEDRSGKIYIGTDRGVSVAEGQQFSRAHLAGKVIRSVCIDSNDDVWFGTATEGLYKMSDMELSRFSTKNGLSDNNIWTIIEDRRHNILIGTELGGVNIFDGKRFSSITAMDGLSHNNVRAIVEGNPGTLWFATYGGGLNRYDGGGVLSFHSKQGLPLNLVKAIAQDHDGNLWFASYEAGLTKFNGEDFIHYNAASGLPSDAVRAIVADKNGALWVGTNEGLSLFDYSRFINYTTSDGLSNNTVNALYCDDLGQIWIGTDRGLSVFDGKNFRSFTVEDGLPHDVIWDITQDNEGRHWIGTFGGGVAVFDGHTFKNYRVSHGLSSNKISSLYKDPRGNIWIGGAEGGLTRFDGDSFLTLNSADGLPDETVYDIVAGENGDIWIGTNKGVSRISFLSAGSQAVNAGDASENNTSLRANYKVIVDSYNRATGFNIADINANSMVFTKIAMAEGNYKAGLIWAACGDGRVIRLDVSAVDKAAMEPKVFLRNLKLDDENVNWFAYRKARDHQDSLAIQQNEMRVYGRILAPQERDTLAQRFRDLRFAGVLPFANVPENLSLPYHLNRITFEYSTVETSRYSLINYQYMLEGQDNDWSPPSKKAFATFSNLWEGDYVFKARAQGLNGVWGEPLVYRFTVRAPWWREPAMLVSYAALSLMVIIAIVKIRERALAKVKSELDNKIRERTGELLAKIQDVEQQRHEAHDQWLEAEHHRVLVEEKNAEIAKQLTNTQASLSALTLQMIQRFHSLNELEKELKRLAADADPSKYNRLFTLIQSHKSVESEWKQFDLYFNRVHKDFNQKLLQTAAELSGYELRLCAFMKMRLKNREIAMLLNIEVASVKMAKYRLKKKLDLDEATDLQTFIESL